VIAGQLKWAAAGAGRGHVAHSGVLVVLKKIISFLVSTSNRLSLVILMIFTEFALLEVNSVVLLHGR
jgi:hypothetical protein